MAAPAEAARTPLRARGPSYIATIALGHGIKHWYIAAFAVYLPHITAEYALSDLAVGAVATIRQIGGGAPNFFVGYVSDRLRGHWHLLLPASFFFAALFMMLAGRSPWLWPMVLAIALAGASASLWHPPAISMLTTRFPRRKGFVIALHGAGSGSGETLGPLVVGLVLTGLLADDWRRYTLWSMIPAVLITGYLYYLLKGGHQPRPLPADHHREPTRMLDFYGLLRYPAYRSLAYANFSRSFAHFGLLALLPVYLAEDLGMNSAGVGFHVGLLTALGVFAGPVYGYFSDRIGRRAPIVAASVVIFAAMTLMGVVQSGIFFTLALAAVGIFLWSVQDIINATAMDAAPPGKEGTVVGFMFTSSFVGAIIAPGLEALAVTLFDSRLAMFFLSGAVMAPAAIVLALAPLRREGQE